MNDPAAFVAAGALVVFGMLFTFVAREVTPYSIFRVMNGADDFFHQRVPWTGLALSAGVGGVLERRDY